MKKILSLVLVLVMVLGLTVPAFATNSYELADPTALYFSACTADTEPSTNKLVDNYKAFIIDRAFEGVDDFVESNVSAIIEGTATEYVGRFNLSTYYSSDLEQYVIGRSSYDGDATAVPGSEETAICVVFYYANGFDSAPTHYEAISLATASKYFDDEGESTGWKELSAEEPEEDNTSGTATIKAVKEEPKLAYSIVIPTTVTDLTEEAHKDVQLGGETGKVSISVTTHNAKTNVYYTVNLENGTLTCGTNKITTSYTYTQGENSAELKNETKVTVYKNQTVTDSTIKVSANEESWQAAPAGEYSATLTFNFVAEEEAEEEATVTVAEALVAGAQYNLKFHYMLSDYSATYTKTADGFELLELLDSQNEDTSYIATMVSSTVDGSKIKFVFGEVITITVDTSTNKYEISGVYANDVTFTSFSVKPAGATEFTEITLTKAE